ncbi:MAG: hypothetical protein KKI08_19525, partial [Armatimonadetes bacterium]|nr:hypothetical protein [Armatimonadota bacterium]
FTAWYYERDSIPGLAYLTQVCDQIDQSQIVLLLISPDALGSRQVTVEVVRSHESNKPFIPVLRGISHAEFQQRQPEWRAALGATASVSIPAQGFEAVLGRIIMGAKALATPVTDEPPAPPAPSLGGDGGRMPHIPSIPYIPPALKQDAPAKTKSAPPPDAEAEKADGGPVSGPRCDGIYASRTTDNSLGIIYRFHDDGRVLKWSQRGPMVPEEALAGTEDEPEGRGDYTVSEGVVSFVIPDSEPNGQDIALTGPVGEPLVLQYHNLRYGLTGETIFDFIPIPAETGALRFDGLYVGRWSATGAVSYHLFKPNGTVLRLSLPAPHPPAVEVFQRIETEHNASATYEVADGIVSFTFQGKPSGPEHATFRGRIGDSLVLTYHDQFNTAGKLRLDFVPVPVIGEESATDDTQSSTCPLRFDGPYVDTRPGDYKYYFFSPDGKFYTAKREDATGPHLGSGTGKYRLDGNAITFSVRLFPKGSLEFEGTVVENAIQYRWQNPANGQSGTAEMRFAGVQVEETAPAATPEDIEASAGPLRFDGVYVERGSAAVGPRTYRFYPDGTVYRRDGTPESLKEPVTPSSHQARGTYVLDGDRISFFALMPMNALRVDFTGTIDGDTIRCVWHSRINDKRGSATLTFVEVEME